MNSIQTFLILWLDTTFKGAAAAKEIPLGVFHEILDLGLERARLPYLYSDHTWKLSSLKRKMDKFARIVNKTFIPSVKGQMAKNECGINFVDMMNRQLKNGEHLSFQEIYDNSITLILAVSKLKFVSTQSKHFFFFN